MEKSRLSQFLDERSQKEWLDALSRISPSVHPVDRLAASLWFAFWPLELREALSDPAGEAEMARLMDLEGQWRLEEELDRSVSFLYGAHHWIAVKNAVLSQDLPASGSLADVMTAVARKVAEAENVDAGLVLGIAAVGLMALRQLGVDTLERLKDEPARAPLLSKDPARVLASRARKSGGIISFLKGVDRPWDVRWEEREPGAVFQAINGQDLATGAAASGGDYRERDYRRIDGPIPVECRVGSCGYCWVGLLSGREKLSEITEFERSRLRYFGYDTVNDPDDPTPPVRLSCQTACHGDVTVTIPSWNGELKRRHDEGRKKLGTA